MAVAGGNRWQKVEKPIFFNQISFDNGELNLIEEAINNRHISGDGPFSKKAEKLLSEMHDGARVLLTPSCSHALELAARLIGFEPGDEVIVPSFAFVTSVSSFVSHGAKPIFCDIDPVTLGLDIEKAENLISSKTRAIVLVHYGGVPANPEGFARLAEKHGLILIEDNAHGLGGRSNGKKLGTFGALSTLSFHETKNISCGEGGALVLNDSRYIERAEILRDKGTDRSQFFRGQVDKYTWHDLGSSWVLSDILAAVLFAQLRNFEQIQEEREQRANRYFEGLADWASGLGVFLQKPSLGTAHLFYLLFGMAAERDGFIRHMKSAGISAVSHYQALHESPYASILSSRNTYLPVSEATSRGLVRLPLSRSLPFNDQERVISRAQEFRV